MRRHFAALFWMVFALGANAQEAAPRAPTMVDVGDYAIATRLYAPPDLARYPVVVLVRGSGNQSVIDDVYTQIHVRAFNAVGIGVLAYDKSGTGASGGTYTGSDFEALGADATQLVRYAQRLPHVSDVGLWGSSQAGWIIPYVTRRVRDLRFAIIASPPGVNPHEQVTHFLHRQALSWGLTPEEALEAERMHRAVALYYAGRATFASAQAEVDRHRGARWFNGVITHPYWDEMTPEGRILDPEQLAQALRERPGAFEIHRSESSFADYTRHYRWLRLPTLMIYGEADQLVPVDRSRAVLEAVLARDTRRRHDFVSYSGADHDIQSPEGRVRQDYLDHMTTWARARFDEN